MVRNVVSKVMWVGRATVFLVGLALILALLFGAASTALAANGNPFLLGKKNVASAVSTLVKQGPGTALRLEVQQGQPPMTVNSTGRVNRLNADRVDGKHANAFLPAGGKAVDADKLDGKDSNEFAVKTAFASGFGANPTTATQFLAPPAQVTVGAGQAVHVSSNKAFGSTAVGGANGLDLYICHRLQGSTATPTAVGGGILENRVAQNTRVTMGLSAVIPNLSAGSYEVGMCGDDDGNGAWNSNEYGYTSALVVTQPSDGAAAASSTTRIQAR